jgi:hypothetical protein
MSKVTTRLGNQDLVNIAKQRFDKQQRSKLPSLVVNLPSRGLIYPTDHPLRKGYIETKYMTAYDEDILTNSSYIRSGIVFDKLLDSIIIDDINIADIATVDRDAILISARINAYGHEYPVKLTDPETNSTSSHIIDLRKIKHNDFKLETDENGEIEYTTAKGDVILFTYGPPTSANTILEVLNSLIRQVNGKRDSYSIDQFLRYQFLALESKTFREYVVDNAPGVDYMYEFEGENGSTFKARFQLGPDLFWF